MFKNLLVAICLAASCGLSLSLSQLIAQPRHPSGHSTSSMPPQEFLAPVPNQLEINKLMDELEIDLCLTREQKVRIKSIYEEHFNSVKHLQPGNTRTYDAMDNRQEELQMELTRKVAAVLDDFQLARYVLFLERRALGREGHKFMDEESNEDQIEDGDYDHEEELPD
ncbi:MAG: hypothetical protein KKA84_03875 [Bacteroidetes bacterium]|nr:hypothetical protein [Bacteroidota bacterium]